MWKALHRGESGDLGVDVRPTPVRGLQVFQHEYRGALAEHEAVAGASNGREACSGSSLLGVVALIASKHATVIGEIGASAAPATATSARPVRISSASADRVQPGCASGGDHDTGPSAPAAHATSHANVLGTK